MFKKSIYVFVLFLFTACFNNSAETFTEGDPQIRANAAHADKPYVLMISIDGYRYDYTERFTPPHLSKMAQEGVRAKSLQSVFPSKTFPNHYSLVTGRYTEGHGIVGNRFYDTDFKALYALGNPITNESRWYAGEPLWNVAENNGMLSACYFWVGSDVEINGQRPTYYKPYNGSISNIERVQQIVDWLKLPVERRPHYLTLYFSIVDSIGHQVGPLDPPAGEAHPLKAAVLEVDQLLGQLFADIEKLNLDVNVIVVSDHGMKNVEEYVYLGGRGINYEGFKVVGRGPIVHFYQLDPNANREALYKSLQRVNEGKYRVYRKEEIPERFHYRHSTRVGDILLVSELGVSTFPNKTFEEHQMELAEMTAAGKAAYRATHGWDPKHIETHGVFYARGPQLKSNYVVDSFENIHVYPLVLDILKIKQKQPIDGRLEVLADTLIQ